jgi:hypothetical protein
MRKGDREMEMLGLILFSEILNGFCMEFEGEGEGILL